MQKQHNNNGAQFCIDVYCHKTNEWIRQAGFVVPLAELDSRRPLEELVRHVRQRVPAIQGEVEQGEQDNVVRVRWSTSRDRRPLFFRYVYVKDDYFPEAEPLFGELEFVDAGPGGGG